MGRRARLGLGQQPSVTQVLDTGLELAGIATTLAVSRRNLWRIGFMVLLLKGPEGPGFRVFLGENT